MRKVVPAVVSAAFGLLTISCTIPPPVIDDATAAAQQATCAAQAPDGKGCAPQTAPQSCDAEWCKEWGYCCNSYNTACTRCSAEEVQSAGGGQTR